MKKKSTIRDGGSTALKTADTVDMAYTFDMVYTVDMFYIVDMWTCGHVDMWT